MNYEILVNKNNLLSSSYVPDNLIVTDNNKNNFHRFKNPNLKPMLEETVYNYFLELQKAALKENMYIIVDSGYRTFEYQKEVFDKTVEEEGMEYAKSFVAIPGTSEHQTGLAVDFAVMRNGCYSDDIKEEDIETKWMKENAYKYGFILRYPKGKEDITGYFYEPWHYRYVGFPLSKIIMEN